MSIEIKFEIENGEERTGIVAENSYLWDAAKRLGVYLEATCEGRGTCDTCAVTIKHGAENLSTPTSGEMQHLTDERRAAGERLACQTRIHKSGEITVMVKEKQTAEAEEKKEREWRKDFQELPFDKKFATLVELEAVALSETFGFVANLPMTLSNKVVDILASFGWEMDKKSRDARRPTEHKSEEPTPKKKPGNQSEKKAKHKSEPQAETE
ncbi:MAG: 2Fe-2S iron-sulfur cluster-binding protein [Pyrinomonadaceae bacterium]